MGSTPVFVGRSAELARLADEHAQTVADGNGRVVVLRGASGMGKSEVIRQFSCALDAPAWIGSSADLGDHAPALLPLRHIVRSLRSDDAAYLSDAPLLRDLVDAGTVADLDLLAVELFEIPAIERGVLVFEDAHWADRATVDFLRIACRLLATSPVTIVVSQRPDLPPRHPLRSGLVDVARFCPVALVDLGPLGRSEVAMLYNELTGDRPDEATLHGLIERAAGHPFYTSALINNVDDTIPHEVGEFITHQLSCLPERVSTIVRLVALGGVVSTDDLVELTSLDEPIVTDAIRAGIEADLLSVDETDVRCRHALVGEAVDRSLLPFESRELHRHLAARVRNSSGDLDAAIRRARHLRLAGERAEAFHASCDVGERALQAGADATALAHLELAIELTDAPDDAATAALHLKAATASRRAGRPEVALRYAERAQLLAGDNADTVAAATVERALAMYAQGDTVGGHAVLQQAVPDHLDGPATANAVALLVNAVGASMAIGDDQSAAYPDPRVQAAVDELGDPHLSARLDEYRGVALSFIGEPTRGSELLVAAQDRFLAVDAHADLARVLVNRLDVGKAFSPRADVETLLADDPTRSIAGLSTSLVADLAAAKADFMLAFGDIAEAEQRVLALSSRREFRVSAQLALVEAEVAFELNDQRRLRSAASRPEVRAALDTPPLAIRAALVLALARSIDEPGAAVDDILDAAAIATDREARTIDLARALRRGFSWCPDDGRHARLREAAARLSGELSDVAPTSLIAADRDVLSLIAIADPAERLAACDAVTARVKSAGWFAAANDLLLQLAADCVVAGDRQRARNLVDELDARAAEHDAHRVRDHARDLRRRARLGRASTTQDAFGLTTREQEVLHLVAAGRTNTEIGNELFISAKTASVHVSNLIRKLEVTNRRDAARRAAELGLV